MKALHVVIFLVATVGAHSQEQQCVQSEFSGEASQGQQRFVQELGQGITFSLLPMGRNAQEPRWGWFNMRVVDESKGIYVFSPSDGNWLLATPDWWSTFIGSPNSDVKRSLGYRVRNLVFPLSGDDKQKLKEASSLIFNAKSTEEEPGAVAALKSMRLGQIKFEITDSVLRPESRP